MGRRQRDHQYTVADTVTLSGIGVHRAEPVSISILPADANTGIVFVRTEGAGADVEIPARWDRVQATELCTVIGQSDRASVSTVEHLMAALVGLGVDNAVVEIDGPEVPVMDGSAAMFVEAIDQVGLREQSARRRYIRVKKTVRVEQGDSYGELRPFDGFRCDVTIEFDTPLIGRQSFDAVMNADTFRKELARARTFGSVKDVEKLWAMGFARGSSLENSVAIADDRVLNPEGTRWPDEFVRHKALDAVGDLALAGNPLLGAYRSFKGGHRLNHAIVEALFRDPDAWEVTEGTAAPEKGHAEIAAGLAVPAYGPEIS